MIRYEIYHLFLRRSVLLIAVAAIITNCVAILHATNTQNEYGYGYIEIQTAYDQLPSDGADCISYTKEKLDALASADYCDELITSSPYQERILYTEIYDRVSEAFYYEQDLNSRLAEAEIKLKLPQLFSPGTFGYRNIQSQIKNYSGLTRLQTSIESSVGVEAATSQHISDAIIAFLVLLFSLALMTMPKEENSFLLLKPMKNGRAKLLTSKLCALQIILFFAVVLVCGLNLLIGHFLFGLGDLSRSIQSLYGFSTSRFSISVGQYLILMVLYKFVWASALGCLMMCLCSFARSSISACAFVIVVLIVETLCYQSSPIWLKYTNLIWISNSKWYFSNYYTLNFFGYPIDTQLVSFVVLGLIILVSCVFSYRRFVTEENVVYEKRNLRRKRTLPLHTNLFRHEGYKLFIQQRGAILLIAFLILQTAIVYLNDYYVNGYDRHYAQILAGAPSTESEEFLVEENARFNEINEELVFLAEQLGSGIIDSETYNYLSQSLAAQLQFEDSFRKAESQYWTVSGLVEDNPNIEFVEIQVYEQVFGTASKQDHTANSIKLAALLAIGLSGIFSIEHISNVELLLQTSHRKRAINKHKIILSLLFAALSALFDFVPKFVFAGCRLGYSGLTASSKSLLFLGQSLDKLSIIQYMSGVVVLCILLSCVAALAVLFVSSKSKSRTTAILTSFLLLLLPILAYSI